MQKIRILLKSRNFEKKCRKGFRDEEEGPGRNEELAKVGEERDK